MFWRVQVSLTKAGEDALEHVLATIYRGVQVKLLHMFAG